MAEDTPAAKRYAVWIDDNFHHMDEEERYQDGEFDNCESAIARCKEIVDEFLLSFYKTGMSARELWELYTGFGDDTFIVTRDRDCSFSGWNYARERCEEICGGSTRDPG
jgi:hypothetical protein